jgi:dephospho-CoA kinase
MPLKIGITGGIGSGKSTICKVFKILEIPVFEADVEAKKLLNSNFNIKNGLVRLYGNDIYTENNAINRKKLASIIFNNNIELQKVNALIHPEVRNEFENWIARQKTPYIIHEAAILFESGFYKMMDFTILVTAPEDLKIKWVNQRDHSTPEEVKARMAKQWNDEQKRSLADLEIKNDNKQLIIPQIIKIDKQLKEYGKIW